MNTTVLFALIALTAGLWWMPVSLLEKSGFLGSWSSFIMSFGALPPLLFIVFFADRKSLSMRETCGAVLMGCALAFYSIAFTETEIIRVMVLFYIAPFWGLILEAVFRGRKIQLVDFISLLLLFLGIAFVQKFNLDLSQSMNLGDVIALLSGVSFALGAFILFGEENTPLPAVTLVVVLATVAVSIGFAVLQKQNIQISNDNYLILLVIILSIGGLYFLPIIAGTLYAANHLNPTNLTMLLSFEIVSGFISASLFSDDAISNIQLIGCGAILLAIILTSQSNKMKESK